MKQILHFMKNYRKEAVIAPAFKLLEACFELFVPLVMAAIIDQGIGKADYGMIWRNGAILLALALIGFGCAVVAQYFAAKAAVGTGTAMRSALYKNIQTLSFADMDQVGTSTMITRMTSDINQVQTAVNLVLRLFLRSPFIVFGAMVMAFTVNVKAALVFVVAIPLLSVIVFSIILLSVPLYKKVQKGLDDILLRTRENLTGARVLRAFSKEEEEEKNFENDNQKLVRMQLFVGRISAMMNPLTYIIVNASIIAIIWIGGKEVYSGIITQGEVLALVNYMSQILVELVKLANLIITINKAMACNERINELLNMSSSMEEGTITCGNNSEYAVEFNKVSMSYGKDQDQALTSFDFKVKKGQTIGIIGGTGSGKSTLVNLIPRFYDVSEGAVLVDGVDVRQYSYQGLREQIGCVMQKAVLFSGTIRENLLWGNANATDEELIAAAQIAQASEIIKEKGLDGKVEENGNNFSGGQKQRLTIARALVRNPKILILDDSASALDYATDAALRKAIAETSKDRTVFIVSQRTSSICMADQIVVLEDGEVAGIGTHDELRSTCPVYEEIYMSQFKKEGE